VFVVGDQLFWVVCAAFYVLDNIRRVGPRQIILAETLRGAWAPLFPLPWYRIGGRSVIVLHLLSPWLLAVHMALLREGAFTNEHLRQSERYLAVYRKRLLPYRVISTTLFAAFFVAGPVATYFFGLAYALLAILPLYLVTLITFLGILIAGRRFWRMSWPQLSLLAVECALCPGFFANVCRKLSLGYARVPGDAVAFVAARAAKDTVHQLESKLNLYLDDLKDHHELRPSDELLIEQYRTSFRA